MLVSDLGFELSRMLGRLCCCTLVALVALDCAFHKESAAGFNTFDSFFHGSTKLPLRLNPDLSPLEGTIGLAFLGLSFVHMDV